jgi:hypothetical protein
MSVSVTTPSPGAPNFYYASDTALGGIVSAVGLVSSTSPVPLWALEIDNTLNAVPVYVKFWATVAAGVVIGTSPPTMQFSAPASKKQTYSFAGRGPHLTTGALTDFGWACVLEPATSGLTAPTAPVAVRILFQQDPPP